MILLVTVLLPLVSGIFLTLKRKGKPVPHSYLEALTILNSVLVYVAILTPSFRSAKLFSLFHGYTLAFHVDGTGMVFSGLVAFLWPLAMLYAFEYLEGDSREQGFYSFYLMSYGVTLGIAYSANLFTLYCFYEMLTLVTFPLVLHYRDRASRSATRKYIYYSLGGAALALISLILLLSENLSTDFVQGGIIQQTAQEGHDKTLYLVVFVLAFFGFGVKAAVWPLHRWLPTASVAPTPVTALLHAVAVVKSGAFAVIRLIYFVYGADYLRDTWAHYCVLGFTLITIAFGSTMALKEIHFKRRLAYSTVANLSYVILGAVMMSPAGHLASLTHLVIHALMKITAFYCAGAVMHKAEKNYIFELNGMAKVMPITFLCFTIAGLSLTGIPLFGGFISKWQIASAAMETGRGYGVLAVIVLLYSAAMTAIYMLTVTVRAYFPSKGTEKALKGVTDPTWRMLLPICVCSFLVILIGLYPTPLLSFLGKVVEGGI